MNLSVLIPTTIKRREFLNSLLNQLRGQIGGIITQTNSMLITTYTSYQSGIEILVDHTERDRIGTKRNRLLANARGKYVCFVDDDDRVSPDYISTILEGIATDPDCLSLRGIMTVDGKNPEVFEHSIKYSEWKTTNNEVKYERMPNHLNVIRASIAKQIKFPEINYGEDHKWSIALHESGLLKTEWYTDKVLYFYDYRSNK